MSDSSPDYGIAPTGYRLPPATHVGLVRIQVADLDRSIAYYEKVIGFRVLERADGVARLGPNGADVTRWRFTRSRAFIRSDGADASASTISRFYCRTGRRSGGFSSIWPTSANRPECPTTS